MANSSYNNQKGITIVELLIVIALVSLISLIIFNIFNIFNESFNTGIDKATLIQDARFCADNITDELKNALIISEITPKESIYHRILLEKNSEKYNSLILEYYKDNSLVEKNVIGTYLKEIEFSTNGNSNIINFTILVGNEKENFIIESSIFLNNINSINIDEGITEIYYTLYE